jgi:hypothetical protein
MVVDWSKWQWRDGQRWEIDVSDVTLSQLLDLLDASRRLVARKHKKKLEMKIAPHHFCKGGSRWVYQARKRVTGQPHVFRMVVKRFRKGLNDCELYMRHMELQAVGQILAHCFNQAVHHRLLSHKILRLEFVKVETLRVNGHHYSLEAYQPGIFVNYNTDVAFGNHEYFSKMLQTFSHWVYQATWGKLLATDFQVVHLRNKFLLSDLALHHWTNDQRFYNTDKGKEGMYTFFRAHRCNSYCKSLGLTPHRLHPK